MIIDKLRLTTMATAIFLLAALAIAPAFARGGDYGVNTGASGQNSNCGGSGQPACTLNWSGYALTYSHTESWGDHVYTFDDFDCTVWISSNGNTSGRGSECDQYQP